MAVQEIVEVPETEAVVDHTPQDVLLRAEQCRQIGNRQRLTRVEPLPREAVIEPVEHAALETCERNRRRPLRYIQPVDHADVQERRQRQKCHRVDDREVEHDE